jgi:Protein of unknown function (DUF3551)
MGGSHDRLLNDHKDRTSADREPVRDLPDGRVAHRGDLRAAQQGDLQMRFSIKILAVLVVLPVVLSKAPANALPYDPYPWCADYSAGNGGGGTNCGFLTIEQCRATVSGIGGFCVPNQFYNPGPAGRSRSSKYH